MEQELGPLSPLECEKIIGVLKRDRELRAVEEARIRQLKQELICLRKRSALKPGIDPARVCARCLSELGRIINRGALCPLCHKKVCKSCRQYGDEDHEWICIYCFKQMQLKAISGEWMHEFNRLSVRRRAKDPPGDQVRRVLHESQRKELLELKTSPESPFELPPPKPPHMPQCDTPHSSQQKAEEGKNVRNLNHEETSESTTSEVNTPVIETNQEKEDQTESLPTSSSPSANRSPKVLPRVNPWSGIEPEPTIPVRLTRLVTLGSVLQHDQWEPSTLKERQPSDEGQYIIHSLSTSSEVTEEMEHYPSSMPLPRKRLSPLKKQQAIPEPNQIDRQQSSVDSGVFSPGPKQDHITEVPTVPSSPLLLTRFSSVGHESEHSVQHLMSESSLSETDEDRHQSNRKSRIVFRKVTMKKKKSVSGTRSLEERHSCTSADTTPVSQKGLTNPSLKHYSFRNSSYRTNHKESLLKSFSPLSAAKSPHFKHSACDREPKIKNCMPTMPKTKTTGIACKETAAYVNLEAHSDNYWIKDVPDASNLPEKINESLQRPKHLSKKSSNPKKIYKRNKDVVKNQKHFITDVNFSEVVAQIQYKDRFSHCPQTDRRNHPDTKRSRKSEFHNKRREYIDSSSALVRSISLPSFKTFSDEWLQPWSKPFCLEDWLWYLEEQPYESRDYKSTLNMLPDDYKLVYVSSSSSLDAISSESDLEIDPEDSCSPQHTHLSQQNHLKVHSHIEISHGASYIEDSDWELNSDTSEDPFLDFEENTLKIIEAKNISVHFSQNNKITSLRSVALEKLFPINKNREIFAEFDSKKNHYFDSLKRKKNEEISGETVLKHQQNFSAFIDLFLFPFSTVESNCSLIPFKQSCPSAKENTSSKMCPDIFYSRKIFECRLLHTTEPTSRTGKERNLIFLPSYIQIISQQSRNPFFSPSHACVIDLANNDNSLFTFTFPALANWFTRSDLINFLDAMTTSHDCSRAVSKRSTLQHVLKNFSISFIFIPDHAYLQNFCHQPGNEICQKDDRMSSEIDLFAANSVLRFKQTVTSTESEGKRVFISFDFQKILDQFKRGAQIFFEKNRHAFYVSFQRKANRFESRRYLNVGPSHFSGDRNREFRVTEARVCSREAWSQLQRGNANASRSPSPVPPAPGNCGNDNPATGWGKERCSIAATTTRVIDLHLGALECGREVPDSADPTSSEGWTVRRDFATAKLDCALRCWGSPPVAAKPEVGVPSALPLPVVLFASDDGPDILDGRPARMYGTAVLGVSEIQPTDDETGKQCAGQLCGAMRSSDIKNGAVSPVDDSDGGKSSESLSLDDKHCDCERDSYLAKSRSMRDDVSRELSYPEQLNSSHMVETENEFMAEPSASFCCDDYFLSDILPYLRYIFCGEYTNISILNETLVQAMTEHDISVSLHESERVDCQCHKPCEVPSSPSIVDATFDKTIDDGEIFSSGDELDKLESDTDSQDTVIEGEAYKRIRSVAIKEKILYANEVLFGESVQGALLNTESFIISDSNTKISTKHNLQADKYVNHRVVKNSSINSELSVASDLGVFPNAGNSSSLITVSSLEQHLYSCENQSHFSLYPNSLSSSSDNIKTVHTSCSNENQISSSYKASPSESLCSSESSDNGSDGEEVILSDTSTSSDEATYIASSAGFRYYSYPSSYRLYTIIEESCEESEKSSRGETPNSRNSDFAYFDKVRSSLSRSPKKMHRKSPTSNSILQSSNTDTKNKVSNIYAVLASSRLEKYFKSGLLDEKHMSYPEDDLTDESGGISSDDEDKTFVKRNERISSKISHGKASNDKQAHASKNLQLNEKSCKDSKYACTSNSSATSCKYKSILDEFALSSASSTSAESCNQTSIKKQNSQTETMKSDSLDNENVSDEEAKYIMNHLIQHITNSNEGMQEENIEKKDGLPMLKILESEIARLMLTVSPASLSAGEPSSSCSSTIGSNNSDYGSDTLESGDDSTSDEDLNEDLPQEKCSLLNMPASVEPVASTSNIDSSAIKSASLLESPSTCDSVVSEETLYICKQLMASLKKIADVTEGADIADNLCNSESQDHTAKQYITDQIVSLMQTVNASHNNSPMLHRFTVNQSPTSHIDSDISQERSDSDSPQPHDEKRGHSKSKTPSESGSETTISASISIPSYDDSDRTPTESEISHEMDELYALLENNGTAQDMIPTKFSYDLDSCGLDEGVSVRTTDSPSSEDDCTFTFSTTWDSNTSGFGTESSLLCGAASKLESLLPISIEERIARYKDAFLNKCPNLNDNDHKSSETRINVILPQPATSDLKSFEESKPSNNCSETQPYSSAFVNTESKEDLTSFENSFDSIISSCSSYLGKNEVSNYNVTSVKIISHNTYPPSSAIHKILSNKIDSTYMEKKLDYKIVSVLDADEDNIISKEANVKATSILDLNDIDNASVQETPSIVSPLPKVMNPKEKASSENDLLVANYRAKSKTSKVFGTKSVGNISELENISNKSTFRDTGYYSFKSSEESFLSLDDSTASQTSTASLTQYRSLTSTETIPEEEESCSKAVTPSKMSLSSGNIPDTVCDNSAGKSSTLPLSLRNKLSTAPGGNHRTRSSFFSTSGVLRKLTMLRDESGNSLRSSPHGRLRMRNRSLSGGSEDERQRKGSVPQIAVSECSEQNQIGRSSAASSEKDSSGVQEDDLDQVFAYHSRSQMSLSSFGGRSESVTSVYSAAGGGRYGTVAVTGEVLFCISYNYKTGTLEINIKECRNLAPVETKRNRSDPYVKIYLLPDRTKSGKRKTKVKKHTLSPVFDELLKFQVTISELETRTLWLSVWHSDRFGRNDFLGEVMLPLGYDAFESPGLKWYPLQERLETFDAPVSYKGDLILSLKYVPPDVTTRKVKKPGDQVKGSLHVLVREARNLMATRSNGTSDPFCKSYLLPDKSKSGKQKTPVFKKSCNPKWNHTFVYDELTVNDLRERCLELTIWDYDKITSNDFLGGVRLCLGTGKFQSREVDWMDSVGEEISLWYTMLERPNTWVDGSLLLRPSMQSRKPA